MKKCILHVLALAPLALALAGCSKPEPAPGSSGAGTPTVMTPDPTPPVAASAPASAAGSASAAAVDPPAAPASVASGSASAPPPSPAKPAAATAATAKTTAVATKDAPTAAAPPPPPAPPPAPLKPASTRVAGKNFTLDVASPGCRVDTPCTMTLRLNAVGEYHVNKEYPYKFLATAGPAVQFLGNGDATTFSRASGDFHEDGEKAGTMTVRFKPSASGEARVSGTYKMSICSAENCQIESQAVTLAVPVM